MQIPKKLGHIWIGPLDAPTNWMNTWKHFHPEWEYTLYDEEFLRDADFETSSQIQEYIRRGHYSGAADLMRYEILWRHGGFLAEADSVCLRATDQLFEDNAELYTVYENEFVRGKLVSPILAAKPKNDFLRHLIDTLKEVPPTELDLPWKETGNLFVARKIEELHPEIVIWPSHYFIPIHFTGVEYKGNDPIYAEQYFGSTKKLYNSSFLRKQWLKRKRRRHEKSLQKQRSQES
ncbi:glycosyltransferase [Thioclava sp. F36-7]|uniref:glycosyltransferase family 32 protein n=1 Tax=Thioclava sp. F36-7 TaxID=1915317 RepID=UPI000997EFD0|nr:glycosyltransferase [Thioclava sp. F36-7]OOY08659.1 hypothetical protein BMI89_10850 [Thioclava sp. F36-7]